MYVEYSTSLNSLINYIARILHKLWQCTTILSIYAKYHDDDDGDTS